MPDAQYLHLKDCQHCGENIDAMWNRCPRCGELAGRHAFPTDGCPGCAEEAAARHRSEDG
jgi:predicted amidophosphoribosyltransferase